MGYNYESCSSCDTETIVSSSFRGQYFCDDQCKAKYALKVLTSHYEVINAARGNVTYSPEAVKDACEHFIKNPDNVDKLLSVAIAQSLSTGLQDKFSISFTSGRFLSVS